MRLNLVEKGLGTEWEKISIIDVELDVQKM